jgi:hypothetical protein
VTVSDPALPWVLLAGSVVGGLIGGLLAAFVDRYVQFGRDDCSVDDGEPHRYACNVHQIERESSP